MSTQQMIRVNVKRVNGKTHYIIILPKDSCTHTNEDDDSWLDRLTEEQLQQLDRAEHENEVSVSDALPEMSEDEDMIEFDAKEQKHKQDIEHDVKLMLELM